MLMLLQPLGQTRLGPSNFAPEGGASAQPAHSRRRHSLGGCARAKPAAAIAAAAAEVSPPDGPAASLIYEMHDQPSRCLGLRPKRGTLTGPAGHACVHLPTSERVRFGARSIWKFGEAIERTRPIQFELDRISIIFSKSHYPAPPPRPSKTLGTGSEINSRQRGERDRAIEGGGAAPSVAVADRLATGCRAGRTTRSLTLKIGPTSAARWPRRPSIERTPIKSPAQ
jgi:hypothetical protein